MHLRDFLGYFSQGFFFFGGYDASVEAYFGAVSVLVWETDGSAKGSDVVFVAGADDVGVCDGLYVAEGGLAVGD